ncbi:MAG TPA: biotin--[acetyl-CoA-carboxylase] ligase [Peptococcaceae bacterium]|nr:biotin--[acetyl-CoA-carboxylase] ligase [Peptococcaceae bacterium]HQD53278.1 biotin--[acetyl-CoA-carboxylase] ligase [Peptococcaceae bacterium]
MKEQILALLTEKQGAYLSGAELSRRLNISRTAVWKHIKSLKDDGYSIAASPRRGYCLLAKPDILAVPEIKSGLTTRVFGQKVSFFPQLDSTNEEAKRLAAAGAPEGTVVVAEQQLQGKGRLGRSWISPPGLGLWFSLILRPPLLPARAAQLTLVSAVAVGRALRVATGLPFALKWPNDVLLDGKKVCGILTELSAEIEKINYVIVGIGLNVHQKPGDFPPELRERALSLKMATGRFFRRAELLRKILAHYEELYFAYLEQGFPMVLQVWRELNCTLGKEVSVTTTEGSFRGTALELSEGGCLLVRKASGEIVKIMAGDVTLCCDYFDN